MKTEPKITGSFVNESFPQGHMLRDRAHFPAPKRIDKDPRSDSRRRHRGTRRCVAAAERGFHDFVLLEMCDQAGGNSRWGENEITAYPWAAHYVPVPGRKAVYVRELFEDLGSSRMANGRKGTYVSRRRNGCFSMDAGRRELSRQSD